MDFTLSKQQQMVQKMYREFAENEVKPLAKKVDAEEYFPKETVEKMGKLGMMGIYFPTEVGGAGGDVLSYVMAVEELSKVCGTTGVIVSAHTSLCCAPIYENGTEEQRRKWLPKIVRGETVMAVCMTEPDFGSDLAHIQCSAVDMGDHYVVNGCKTFISNGMVADLFVVAVRTNPNAEKAHKGISLLLIEADSEGLTRQLIPKIGLQAQDTAQIFFENVKVPKSNLIGEENRGFYVLMQHLEAERIMAAYGSIGTVEHTLALTKEYVKQRILFGKPLSSFQNTQYKLAQLNTEYNLALNYLDCVLLDYMAGKKDINTDCSMIKYYTSELAFRAADVCVQLFGGYGICTEVPISRQFCDTRIMRFMGGTTETQMGVVAGGLGIK